MTRKIDEQIEHYIRSSKAGKLGSLYTIKQNDTSTELWYRNTCIFRREWDYVGVPLANWDLVGVRTLANGDYAGSVIILDNGGYMTVTTKGKINAALAAVLPMSYKVVQRKGTWFLTTPLGDYWEWTTNKVEITCCAYDISFRCI